MEAQVERGVGAVQGRSVGDATRSSIQQRVATLLFVLLTLLTSPLLPPATSTTPTAATSP